MPSFTLAFDSICIILAGYMTWKQVYTYLRNEDFSEIAFQRFADGNGYNYPAYTICLEDNNLRQIYRKFKVKTKKDCKNEYFVPEDEYQTSSLCPNGCHIKNENDKLIIFNKTIEERCPELDTPAFPLDHNYYQDNDYTHPMNQGIPPSFGYPSLDTGNEIAFKRSQNDVKDISRESTSFQLFRKKRFVSLHDLPKNKTDFDLEYRDGTRMVLLQKENKTYLIGPEQYQLLLMGQKRHFNYRFTPKNGTSETKKLLFDADDILNLNYNETTVKLSNLVQDIRMEMENGSVYGWNTDDYKNKTTKCFLEIEDDEDLAYNLDTGACDPYISFKSQFDQIIPIPYPLEKTYQDPTRICYSPKLNPTSIKKKDQIVFDLQRMLHDFYGEFESFSNSRLTWNNPMMKIYIHMQGQFIREIGRSIAELTARDLTPYCYRMPAFKGYPTILYMESYWDDCHGTKISFDISHVTLLRSRHDAANSCDRNLINEDSKILKTLIKEKNISCVPSYWKEFEFARGIQECNDTSQYRYISEITSNFTNYGKDGRIKKIRKRFGQPCDEMMIVTSKTREKGRYFQAKDFNENNMLDEDEGMLYLDINFRNTNPIFQIIENEQSFTVESCWAGIGGFVGIFIGISLREAPRLISQFLQFFQKILQGRN